MMLAITHIEQVISILLTNNKGDNSINQYSYEELGWSTFSSCIGNDNHELSTQKETNTS